MKRIFLDTSALIAIECCVDRYHEEAVKIVEKINNQRLGVVISDHVFAETVTITRRRLGIKEAKMVGDNLRNSKIITMVSANEDVFNTAWDTLIKYKDQDFSFVDCLSFALMKHLDIRTAFTFDEHFSHMGFDILS